MWSLQLKLFSFDALAYRSCDGLRGIVHLSFHNLCVHMHVQRVNCQRNCSLFPRGLHWESKLYKLKRSIGNQRLKNLAILWCGCCVWGLFWGGLVRVTLLSEIVLFNGIFHYNCIYSFVTFVPWSSLFLYLVCPLIAFCLWLVAFLKVPC